MLHPAQSLLRRLLLMLLKRSRQLVVEPLSTFRMLLTLGNTGLVTWPCPHRRSERRRQKQGQSGPESRTSAEPTAYPAPIVESHQQQPHDLSGLGRSSFKRILEASWNSTITRTASARWGWVTDGSSPNGPTPKLSATRNPARVKAIGAPTESRLNFFARSARIREAGQRTRTGRARVTSFSERDVSVGRIAEHASTPVRMHEHSAVEPAHHSPEPDSTGVDPVEIGGTDGSRSSRADQTRVSSNTMNRTLGAPSSTRSGSGQAGDETSKVRRVRPWGTSPRAHTP